MLAYEHQTESVVEPLKIIRVRAQTPGVHLIVHEVV